MPRVLVTGGAGFIGSHTVDALLERGYDVRVLDALLPPVHARGQIPEYMPRDDIEFVLDDVRNHDAWARALEGVEAVFHLAAYQDYLTDFSTFFHTNTVSTALLFEVIVEKSLPVAKVVIASSQAAYGEGIYSCSGCGLGEIFPEARPESRLRGGRWDHTCPSCGAVLHPGWTDEAIVHPQNQYAISKYTQEMVALNLARRYQIPTVCLRYSIVQGPRQSFRNAYSGVLRIFAQRLVSGKPPICYEDGNQLRDYVSVYDVARANLLVLEHDGANYQVFNVGGDRKVTVIDYARLIADRAAADLEPEIPGIYRFGDSRHIMSDVAKLRALGWSPEVSLSEIVDTYLEWARSQPDFDDYSEAAAARMEALGTLRAANPG